MIEKLIKFIQSLKTLQTIDYVKSSDDIEAPRHATKLSAGADLRSNEEITVEPHKTALVHTGLYLRIPEHFFLDIRPRSGLALHHGITIINTPATIDADYRGEIMIPLYNTSDVPFVVHRGERIAQALLMRRYEIRWNQVESLDEQTERGNKGFGSSGL